jgi:quinoprotein glucose dehydrogenase
VPYRHPMIDRRSFLKRGAAWFAAGSILSRTFSRAPSGHSSSYEREWRYYGGDRGCMRYSSLDQINPSNVRNLRVAWTYRTGDAMKRPRTTIECTPIVVNGVMYLTTPLLKVCALEAATGALLWSFDPFTSVLSPQGANASVAGAESPRGVNRGVTYWQDGKDKRIFVTALSNLICLDANTGNPIPSFGKKGVVDLAQGLGRDISGMLYDVTSPGVTYKGLIILGSEVGEGPEPAAPGHVRAFDVRTGKQVWIFHTIPEPGEVGHETWQGDSWKTTGGANDWGGLSIDEKRGWVFLATGSAAFDFYGGERLGPNPFANCVIALEAQTGKRIWHYQVVHHDLWDRDVACPPMLVRINHEGHQTDAVAQSTKFAQLFVLDRETGKPLFPVEERPVPSSDVPGEKASPTQPHVLKPPPYTRQVFTQDELTNISLEAHAYALERFKKARSGNEWWPPDLQQETIVFPGYDGGTDWGGGSFDPATGWFYINSHDEPWIVKLVPAPPGSRFRYDLASGYERFVDQEGYAAIKPPWGQLTAIDLNRGEIVWQVVLGEHKELTARGIPPTGTQNMGGSVVTAGGLIFIGATQDEKFRAFDKNTGKVLWEADLPAGGYASPCTYEVRGKQYVVIAAGGGGKPRTKAGDAFVAFALP